MPRTHYRLMDVAVLLVQLQLIAAAIIALIPVSFQAERVSLAICGCLVAAAWWWEGVRMLSHARVEKPVYRVWFLGLLTPLGYLFSVGIVTLPVAFCAVIMLLFVTFPRLEWWAFFVAAIVLVCGGLIAAAVLACRRACKWFVQQAGDQHPDEADTDIGIDADNVIRSHSPERLPGSCTPGKTTAQ